MLVVVVAEVIVRSAAAVRCSQRAVFFYVLRSGKSVCHTMRYKQTNMKLRIDTILDEQYGLLNKIGCTDATSLITQNNNARLGLNRVSLFIMLNR